MSFSKMSFQPEIGENIKNKQRWNAWEENPNTFMMVTESMRGPRVKNVTLL